MRKINTILGGLILFLGSAVFGQSDPNPISVQSSIQDFTSGQSSKIYTGSFVPVFSHKENTKGSRYLFDDWVHGSAVGANNFVLDSSGYLFNYDKITQHLFITKDKKNVIEVNNEELKSFTFRRDSQEYIYKHVGQIDDTHFFQELVFKEGKFSLYKLTHTHLKQADYFTDGKFESGNPYDEYMDHIDYFILFPDGKLYKDIKATRKSINDILSMEKTRVDDYFSHHRGSFIDEAFLTGLVQFLDQ